MLSPVLLELLRDWWRICAAKGLAVPRPRSAPTHNGSRRGNVPPASTSIGSTSCKLMIACRCESYPAKAVAGRSESSCCGRRGNAGSEV